MRFTLKYACLLVAVLFTVVCFQSCKKVEGCSDPNAENYNSDVDKDDGSCFYARDKFIGLYGGGDICEGGEVTQNIILVEESATGFDAISITNQTIDVTVSGVVIGNTFTINDTFVQDGTTFNMDATGTYSIDADGQERIDIDYVISGSDSGQILSQSCLGVWLKS